MLVEFDDCQRKYNFMYPQMYFQNIVMINVPIVESISLDIMVDG